jgi:uncharacterized integral membrane protein
MRLLLRVFWIALVVAAMVVGWKFAAANAGQVTISYVFGELAPVPVWLALLVAFGAGGVLAGLVGSYQMAKLGLVARRYRKSVRGLEAEVHELRNLPLAGGEPDLGDEGGRPVAAPGVSRERGG